MPFFKIEIVISTIIASFKNTKSASRASRFNLLLVSHNIDIDEKLNREDMIKANKRTFNLITAANNYIETFIFR